jgi:hypothetical protein
MHRRLHVLNAQQLNLAAYSKETFWGVARCVRNRTTCTTKTTAARAAITTKKVGTVCAFVLFVMFTRQANDTRLCT